MRRPGPSLNATRTPRLTVLLVLLTILAGCQARAHEAPSATPVTASPAPFPESPAAAPSQAPPDTQRYANRCLPDQLALGWYGRISEPTMQHTLALTLTNESTTGCYLYGYPGISLVDAQGNVLPLDYEWTGDQVVTSRPPSRVDVAPGTVAYVTTNKNTCVSADLASAVSVRLIPPDDLSALSVSIAGNVSMDYCGVGDPGSVLHISPVEPSYLDTIAH